jgi:hypothetical protein
MSDWGNQRLFDLIAEESKLLYFFDRVDKKATRPAIYITSGPIGFRREAGSDDKWTLWVGDGVKWFSFPTFEEAVTKADEISKGVKEGIIIRKMEMKN